MLKGVLFGSRTKNKESDHNLGGFSGSLKDNYIIPVILQKIQ